MKKNKGFTLIELLAVIVILGLLMAIAIPSVTKYINESRKKTLVTTISNYISALMIEVNDFNYMFTDSNTIYAVPIECIALEKGGSDPFGRWEPALHEHWAYVLVYYDDETSSYKYGFTFKDDAGYGLVPTFIDELDKSGKDITTSENFIKPDPYASGYGPVNYPSYVDTFIGSLYSSGNDQIKNVKTILGVKKGDGVNTCTILREEEYYFANILGDVNGDGNITLDDYYNARDVLNNETKGICFNGVSFLSTGKNLYDEDGNLFASRYNINYHDKNNSFNSRDIMGLKNLVDSLGFTIDHDFENRCVNTNDDGEKECLCNLR